MDPSELHTHTTPKEIQKVEVLDLAYLGMPLFLDMST